MPGLTEEQRDKVVELYTTRRADGSYPTQEEIGEQFDRSGATICYYLKRRGIDGNSRKGSNNAVLSEDDIEWAIERYTTKYSDGTWPSMYEIAEELGVAMPTIRHHLRKNGVERRSYSEAVSGGKLNTYPLPEWDPPLCKCGCGEEVKWCRNGDRWYKYVKGHQFPKRPYHDRDWLYEQYVELGKPVTQIAEEIDSGTTTIQRYIRRHGIPRRTQGESLALSGNVRKEKNGSWKGGVADWDYVFNWKTEIMPAIRKRDNYTCQLCDTAFDKRSKRLHVHHIDEDKTNNHPHNLIALCVSCHHPLHGNEEVRPRLTALAKERPEVEYRY